MLWFKGWLETRIRALVAIGACLLMVILNRRAFAAAPPALANTFTFVWAMIPSAMGLSGAGVRTQPAFRAMKGVHNSMYFTLALPVSRLRLLAVRATLGLIETAAVIAVVCGATWASVPALRSHVTIAGLFAYFITVTCCVSAFYFLSVLFATFLDDGQWLPFAGLISVAALAFALPKVSRRLPFLNIFQAMGTSSPLFTHMMPWASMAVSVGAGIALLLAAARVIELREY